MQLTVKAYDEGGRSGTSRVIVNIQRDEKPPSFIGAPYTFEFEDNRRVGDLLYTEIRAQDPDGSVICVHRFIARYTSISNVLSKEI